MIEYSVIGACVAYLIGSGAGFQRRIRYTISVYGLIGMAIASVFVFNLLYAVIFLVSGLFLALLIDVAAIASFRTRIELELKKMDEDV